MKRFDLTLPRPKGRRALYVASEPIAGSRGASASTIASVSLSGGWVVDAERAETYHPQGGCSWTHRETTLSALIAEYPQHADALIALHEDLLLDAEEAISRAEIRLAVRRAEAQTAHEHLSRGRSVGGNTAAPPTPDPAPEQGSGAITPDATRSSDAS